MTARQTQGGHDHGEAAFLHARTVLKFCVASGLTASVELFHDGSGALVLYHDSIPAPVAKTLETMVHSERWASGPDGTMILKSCCGWHP